MLETMGSALPLTSLNHISVVCRSVEKSLHFYQNVLGFLPIRRPGSFDFDGAWLFGYGIGIHLLQSQDPENMSVITEINPKDNHISFQFTASALFAFTNERTCESMVAVERKLKEMEISYVERRVEEGGIYVDQLFFHDPDGFMIEICNCENLPLVSLTGDPIFSCSRLNNFNKKQQQHHQQMMVLPTTIHVKEEYQCS